MRDWMKFITVIVAIIAMSCEQCKECSYTYTVTTINQTPNGEEEVTVTKTGYVYGDDGLAWQEECIKKDESFTIESAYQEEEATTLLDDFEYTCTDK